MDSDWKYSMILGIIASGQISMSSSGGAPTFSATGGTKSTSGVYTYHLFTGNGTFTPNSSGTVEIIAVGGGGKGGTVNQDGKSAFAYGGAGGGGRYVLSTGVAVTAQAYAVVIGNGSNTYATAGGTSNVGALITAAGGSSGRSDDVSGTQYGAGGTAPSGAGSPCRISAPKGSGGGASNSTNGFTASAGVGGSGGGGTVNPWPVGGTGFVGGGGGALGGSGGTYGGGAGSTGDSISTQNGTAGTANTGGGGGAAGGDAFAGNGNGGNGGTGIVIVRYLT